MPTLPIHVLEILDDEESRVHFNVFCSRRCASVPLDLCRTCAHFFSDGPNGVTCDAPVPSSAIGADDRRHLFTGENAVMRAVHAGDLLGPRTVALRDGTCVSPLMTDAQLEAAPAFVVIDERGHPVQTLVRRDAFAAHALRESATADEALDLMLHRHVRFVPLVDVEGRLVGLLTDLDVLRWVAEIKRSRAR